MFRLPERLEGEEQLRRLEEASTALWPSGVVREFREEVAEARNEHFHAYAWEVNFRGLVRDYAARGTQWEEPWRKRVANARQWAETHMQRFYWHLWRAEGLMDYGQRHAQAEVAAMDAALRRHGIEQEKRAFRKRWAQRPLPRKTDE